MSRKERVNHLVDIWLNGITSIDNDAGWDGDSILARVIDYGFLLPPTGNDQSNAAMINALEKVRAPHALYPIVRAVIVGALRDKPHYVIPILSVRFYVGENPITKRVFSNDDRMVIIGMDEARFYNNLNRGYRYLDDKLKGAMQYEQSKLIA